MIMLVLCLCVAIFATKSYNDKTPIRQATLWQIDNVHEIGSKLSKDIYNYIQKNDVKNIEQLSGLKGIGEKRMKYLKEVFR